VTAADQRQREAVVTAFGVPRETADRFQVLVDELRRWQGIKNLVGPATLAEAWSRHIADSLQLLDLAPGASTWLDLGSGAGFPGLVLAIAGRERGLAVHLVVLRQVARLTDAPATVHAARLETVIPAFVGRADVVTARALAPLTQLVAWTQPLLANGTVGLFPKGRDVVSELTAARESWRFDADILPSRTDPEGRILRLSSLSPEPS
jgi:16S rRNA (guanine527-N7)-methyltransferase